MDDTRLTMESVAKMSTYELRREVEKRGVLGELKTINHETLLRRLVQVIVQEDRERERTSVVDPEGGEPTELTNSRLERMQRGKAERKAAAVERSKRRQKDQTYFEGKKMANTQPECSQQDSSIQEALDGDEEVATSNINPRRFKVFVR